MGKFAGVGVLERHECGAEEALRLKNRPSSTKNSSDDRKPFFDFLQRCIRAALAHKPRRFPQKKSITSRRHIYSRDKSDLHVRNHMFKSAARPQKQVSKIMMHPAVRFFGPPMVTLPPDAWGSTPRRERSPDAAVAPSSYHLIFACS